MDRFRAFFSYFSVMLPACSHTPFFLAISENRSVILPGTPLACPAISGPIYSTVSGNTTKTAPCCTASLVLSSIFLRFSSLFCCESICTRATRKSFILLPPAFCGAYLLLFTGLPVNSNAYFAPFFNCFVSVFFLIPIV